MEKKISLATFEQVAADNGYEVFTAEEVAAYYKDGLQKSMKNELTSDEKELFAADIAFLQKAICIDENGKEVTRYFRPEQVNWEKTEDGVLLKGIAGVFADTPTNRKLNRVGEAFVPSPDFMKSLESEEIDEDIIKAMRTGRYADTPENRRLHRVGQPYAKREGKGTEETDKEKKRVANGGKADSDDKKKSEVTPSEASKSFFESKFKNLKWKKGGDEDYPSVVAHKKFRGVPIDIEIDEDGQGEIIIGDADEGIEFGALTSEKAAKELWDTILEELEYYED